MNIEDIFLEEQKRQEFTRARKDLVTKVRIKSLAILQAKGIILATEISLRFDCYAQQIVVEYEVPSILPNLPREYPLRYGIIITLDLLYMDEPTFLEYLNVIKADTIQEMNLKTTGKYEGE